MSRYAFPVCGHVRFSPCDSTSSSSLCSSAPIHPGVCLFFPRWRRKGAPAPNTSSHRRLADVHGLFFSFSFAFTIPGGECKQTNGQASPKRKQRVLQKMHVAKNPKKKNRFKRPQPTAPDKCAESREKKSQTRPCQRRFFFSMTDPSDECGQSVLLVFFLHARRKERDRRPKDVPVTLEKKSV